MQSFTSNVKFLNSFIVRAPEANKNKIQTIADLYEQKKIVNFKTALNTTMFLASTHKSVIKSGKADKEFQKVFDKYDIAVPMTGRIQRQIKAKRPRHRNEVTEDEIQKLHTELLGSNSKYYFIDVILYKNTEETNDEKTAKSQARATGSNYYRIVASL